MGRTLQVLAAGILLSLAATAALAGTESNPEITDPLDDSADSSIDVNASWIQSDENRVYFTIQVQNLQAPGIGETQQFCWTFWLGGSDYTLGAQFQVESTVDMGTAENFYLVNTYENCQDPQDNEDPSGERDTTEDYIQWTVGKEKLGNPTADDTIFDHYVYTSVDSPSASPSDQAPDEGYGRNYTFPATGNGGGPGPGPGPGPDGDSAPTVGPAVLAGAGLLVVLAAGGGYYLWTHRTPKLSLECPDPERVAHPGQGTNFPVRIENHGAEEVNAELEAKGVPEGWVAFVPLPTMELEAGEAKELWVTVKPPGDAEIGATTEVELVARIRGQESSTRKITMRTVVEETGPEAAV